jgi:hypothetical protein
MSPCGIVDVRVCARTDCPLAHHAVEQVLHFTAPKVGASMANRTFSVQGQPQTMTVKELISKDPLAVLQMKSDAKSAVEHMLEMLKRQNGGAAADAGASANEEIPNLVENFEDVAAKTD